MTKEKRIALIVTSVMLIVCLLTLSVFAWIVVFQNSLAVRTGDASISVVGYYDIIEIGDTANYNDLLLSLNDFDDLAASEFIALKFVITNETTYDSLLSLRFSDFFEYIFDHFDAYATAYNSSYSVDYDNIETTLAENIYQLAITQTAKLTINIDNAYYVDSNEVTTQLIGEDRFLWKYSNGERFFENIPIAGEEEITLYFTLSNLQSTTSTNAYKNWLCGTSSDEGVGQTFAANYHLGSTFSALTSTNQAIVDSYLGYFTYCEFSSLNTESTMAAELNLSIDYFEFICESNASPTTESSSCAITHGGINHNTQ